MDIVISSFTSRDVFNSVETYLVSKSSEWAGRVITALKSGLTYLEDPRMASLTVFMTNFAILELAVRISRLIGSCYRSSSEMGRRIKLAFEITVASGLTIVGNVALIKATGIALHPGVIAALIGATFMIKYNLENYLEHDQPIGK